MLSFVVAENGETWIELHAVARVVEADSHHNISLGHFGVRLRELENASEDGVLTVLAGLPG